MDTRTKIVSPTEIPAGARVLAGYFDPLLAGDVIEIAGLKDERPLAVVVLDPPEPILAARARAELVAALACVDAVVVGPSPALEPALHLEDGHARRAAAFVERVRERQR
jgi:hypothetical protein